MNNPREGACAACGAQASRPVEDALRARVAELERELGAVRAERDFLYAALEHVPVGLELYDHDGVALWLNRAMVEFTGLPSPEVAVGRFNILTDPFSVTTGMVAYYRRAYAGEVVHTREFAIDLQLAAIDWGASSKQIRFRMVLCPQRGADGRVLRVLAVMFEVTQHHVARRVAERLLDIASDEEASRLIASTLADEVDIAMARVWRVVDGGAMTLVAHHERLASVAEPRAHFAEETRAAGMTQARLPGDGDVAPSEGSVEGTAGAPLHAHVAAPIKLSAGVIGVIEVGTTSRYLATQALPAMVERLAELYAEFFTRTQAQRRFEALFERSPDPTLVVDQGGVVLAANERARALLGEAPGSLATVFPESETFPPQHAEVFRAGTRDWGAAVWIERRSVSTSGETIPTETAVAPLIADLHDSTKTAVLVLRDLRARQRHESALRNSLEEKVTLLQEVHHRVKNNLQIVSSLVNMQADRLADEAARDALAECSHRVHAMSLVHQILYGSDTLSSIPLHEYATSLAQHLRDSVDPRCVLTLRLAPVRVSLADAIPCGLILNELLTNAIKHGRGPDGRCVVAVELRAEPEGFELRVLDSGPGFALPVPRGSLGIQLVQALARQLRGTLSTSPPRDGDPAAVRLRVGGERPAESPSTPLTRPYE